MVRKRLIYAEIKRNSEEILSLGMMDYARLDVCMRRRQRLFHALGVAHGISAPEEWEIELADEVVSDNRRIERFIASMKESLSKRMRRMERDARKISEYGKF